MKTMCLLFSVLLLTGCASSVTSSDVVRAETELYAFNMFEKSGSSSYESDRVAALAYCAAESIENGDDLYQLKESVTHQVVYTFNDPLRKNIFGLARNIQATIVREIIFSDIRTEEEVITLVLSALRGIEDGATLYNGSLAAAEGPRYDE